MVRLVLFHGLAPGLNNVIRYILCCILTGARYFANWQSAGTPIFCKGLQLCCQVISIDDHCMTRTHLSSDLSTGDWRPQFWREIRQVFLKQAAYAIWTLINPRGLCVTSRKTYLLLKLYLSLSGVFCVKIISLNQSIVKEFVKKNGLTSIGKIFCSHIKTTGLCTGNDYAEMGCLLQGCYSFSL